MLVPTNKSGDKLKETEKYGGESKDLFRSINNRSDDYDEKNISKSNSIQMMIHL